MACGSISSLRHDKHYAITVQLATFMHFVHEEQLTN